LKDIIRKDVKELKGGLDWKSRAAVREGWEIGCVTGWFC